MNVTGANDQPLSSPHLDRFNVKQSPAGEDRGQVEFERSSGKYKPIDTAPAVDRTKGKIADLDDVVPRSGVDNIAAGGDNSVIAIFTEEAVIAGAADQNIVAEAPDQKVLACAAFQPVQIPASHCGIVAIAGDEKIIAPSKIGDADQRALGAGHNIVALAHHQIPVDGTRVGNDVVAEPRLDQAVNQSAGQVDDLVPGLLRRRKAVFRTTEICDVGANNSRILDPHRLVSPCRRRDPDRSMDPPNA